MELGNTSIEPQLPPSYRFKTQPYNHQVAAFNFCRNKNFFALFMEQGTGKTKVLIDLACDMFLAGEIEAVLLIAPNGVHSQWGKEQLPLHCAVPSSWATYKSTLSKGKRILLNNWINTGPGVNLKWLLANVEAFSYDTHTDLFVQFLKLHKTLLVIDEATAIKNPSANRTISILSKLGEAQYRGKSLVSYKPFSTKRAILTGTPVTNSVYDVWAMFYFLQPNFFGRTYYSFKAHYGIEAKMEIFIKGRAQKITKPLSKREIASVQTMLNDGVHFLEVADKVGLKPEDVLYLKSNPDCTVPYKNLMELKKTIAPYAFFARKKDCYDLPDKTYEKVLVQATDEQTRLYNDLSNEYITQFYDSEVSVQQKVALYIRLSQITGGFLPYEDEETGAKEIRPTDKTNPKLDMVLQKMEEATYPLIITTRFRAEAQMLYAKLSEKHKDKRVELVLGGRSTNERVIEDYKKGLVDILVANERMIQEGHNLQNGDTIYRYSFGYSIKVNEQLEDRIHRDGQKSDKVLYLYFIMEDTIDEEIYASLQAGKSLLEYMRDTSVKEFLTTKSEERKKEFLDE